MNPLNNLIKNMLSDARISIQALPQCPDISLYLVDPVTMNRAFDLDEIRRIWEHTAYWAFCWASGQVLAQHILDHPELVKDKKILDFGSGSGVVAIAAMKAGAKQAIACDIDPDALISCAENAKLNGVSIELSDDLFTIQDNDIDLLIAADVLYDRANLSFLDTFFEYAQEVLLADSRIKDFSHPQYRHIRKQESFTVPDLDELDEFRYVNLYTGIKPQ
ncbi:class I SAM-dependent methyltransferase [Bermanella sp. WJH001]|uniref:class I SAM-dependent methyltransferase n=1 Tax=Bermanella sp. WJH001 TaxID=3048005 RepID=UPI0024BDDAF1|nr:50S ribosomal protein L11 methyltransferase [Bermanella sp. WJH001]MDJ1539325.1 50S ribosomal protein L11 methyltransferase [Bermanella sp. WJH001]